MRLKFVALAALALSTSAGADNYLDDRSTPESLIRSLYNAINLHQYGRAYDYFSEAPAKDFATFAKGYEDTDHVDVMLGEAGGDGAAGSTFYNLPTAIRSQGKDGKLSYFAGCYTVRAINADQDPPYKPLHIQQAKLKPIKADDYASYALPKCGDVFAPEKELPTNTAELLAKAKLQFAKENADHCNKISEVLAGASEPQVSFLNYHKKAEFPKTEPQQATLFKFVCGLSAYYETNVFYLADGSNGLRRLSFAEPQTDITYIGEDSAKLKSMKVTGFISSAELVNAGYDPKTSMITSFAKWRGIGDAYSAGEWQFLQGQFVLKNYVIDPTYDDKQNPITIIKNGQTTLKP